MQKHEWNSNITVNERRQVPNRTNCMIYKVQTGTQLIYIFWRPDGLQRSQRCLSGVSNFYFVISLLIAWLRSTRENSPGCTCIFCVRKCYEKVLFPSALKEFSQNEHLRGSHRPRHRARPPPQKPLPLPPQLSPPKARSVLAASQAAETSPVSCIPVKYLGTLQTLAGTCGTNLLQAKVGESKRNWGVMPDIWNPWAWPKSIRG